MLDSGNVRRMVRARAKNAGLTRRVHPHAMRHTFAKDLLAAETNVVVIKEALGHSNLNTTATYLSHIGGSDVVAITSQMEWTL